MNIRTIKHLREEEVWMPPQGYEKKVFAYSIPTVVLKKPSWKIIEKKSRHRPSCCLLHLLLV